MSQISKIEFIDQFVEDLFSLGVRSGGILMVHPALKPFRYVPGGALTIVEGLIKVLGENGTLLMPGLSWENVSRKNPRFDITRTPSCVGIVAETFRLSPGVVCSMHPTHSVCGYGNLAEELTSRHIKDHTPCGPNSPFHLIPEYEGQILMLACGLVYNTSMHAVEEIFEPKYLYGPTINYVLTDINNQTLEKEYIPHNFAGWQQRYDRVEKILPSPNLRSGEIAGTLSYLLDARAFWEIAAEMMSINDLYFIDRTK